MLTESYAPPKPSSSLNQRQPVAQYHREASLYFWVLPRPTCNPPTASETHLRKNDCDHGKLSIDRRAVLHTVLVRLPNPLSLNSICVCARVPPQQPAHAALSCRTPLAEQTTDPCDLTPTAPDTAGASVTSSSSSTSGWSGTDGRRWRGTPTTATTATTA